MGTYVKGEELINFNFGTDLSIAEKQRFVNSVVDIVVNDLERKYNFILRDLIFDYFIIEYLTDIDTTEFRESSSFVDDVEQFLEETNIVEIVKANAFPTLFDEINDAIDKSIEYITGIHTNPIGDALASLVSTIENKMNEFDMGSMMDMAQKFAGMTDDLNVDSIVNAYINSDMRKKNLEEITESKKTKKSNKNNKTKKNEIKMSEGLGEFIRAVVEENKAEKTEKAEIVDI